MPSESTANYPLHQIDRVHSKQAGHGIKRSKNIQAAVYGHIRALRALGRKEINTGEIAEALSLSVSEVNRAIRSLQKRGVKALNA